jgi:hypothetical protein
MQTQFPQWHGQPVPPDCEALRRAIRDTLPVRAMWHVWSETRKHRQVPVGSTSRDPALCTADALAVTLTHWLRHAYGDMAAEACAANLKWPDKFRAALDLPPVTTTPPVTTEDADNMAITPPAAAPGDLQAAVAALTAALAATRAAGVDEDAVRRIVDDRLKDAGPAIATAVGATLDQRIKDAIANAILPTRVVFQATPEAEPKDLGIVHKHFPHLLRLIRLRDHNGRAGCIWLAGPAGSGKTSAAEKAAEALGIPFYPTGAFNSEHVIFGFVDAGGKYHRTPFREAWEHGGAFCLDEADACDPAALLTLNAALANGVATFPDGAILKRHKDCCIIATANTWGTGPTAQYVGRARLDDAAMDRFKLRIDWGYDEALELAIVPEAQHGWVRKVQKWRKRAEEIGARVLISPRTSIWGASLLADGATEKETIATVLGGVDADTLTRLMA